MQKKTNRAASEKKNLNDREGLAAYFNIDSKIIHKIWVVSQIFAFIGTFTYIVCAFKLPKKRDNTIVDSE